MRRSHLFLVLTLAGCAGAKSSLQAPRPVFSAERFFAGHTEGEGRLKIAFSSARAVSVHGDGEVEPDGTLVLDQLVEQEGKDPERREWRIKRTGSGYTGTLTDAEGPVRGDVRGNRLHLQFKMKGGTKAEQWIYLQPDGKTALNRMRVSKLGVTVATLDETIRKQAE